MKVAKSLLCAAAAAAVVASGAKAHAHGEVDVERPSAEGHAGAHSGVEAAEEHEGGPEADEGAEHAGERHHEEEEKLKAGIDLVLGWGKVPFAAQNLPTSGSPGVTYTRAEDTSSNVQSFLLGGSYEVAEHVEVGVLLPFTFATFSPDASASRSTTSFGNLEVEGAYGAHLAHGLKLEGALAVALPTAQGDEIPPDLANAPATMVDQTAYDRFSLNRAAASARGYEVNSLFEAKRLGLIPKVALAYRMNALSLEPFLKLENLIATSSSLENKYVGELVPGLRVAYRVQRMFEVAVRGWFNVGFAGGDEDKKTSVAVEPDVLLRFGPFRPYGGVIIPVAGPPSDSKFVGVRLGLVGQF
jgi:hypothetical protein